MNYRTLTEALGFDIPISVPIILAIYILAILLVGLWASKKVNSTEGWYVGNRSIGAWITALSHGASAQGGSMYIAGPAFAWEAGIASLWAVPGEAIGPVLNFKLVGRRMAQYTKNAGIFTIPEFLGHRYDSKLVRVLSLIITLISTLISLAVEFIAMGVLVSCITGLPYIVSVIIGAAVILVYTGLGGYFAVAYTEFIQAIVMIMGLLILVPVCFIAIGGMEGIMSGLEEANRGLATVWGGDYYLKKAPLMIAGVALVYMIGYMGQPHLIIKTVALRDDKAIKKAPVIGAVFGLIFALGIYAIGIIGRAMYPELLMLPGENAEYIMPIMCFNNLPAPVAGVVLAGAVAAIMSTSSALLLVIGASLGNDYINIKDANISDKQAMKLTRYGTYFAGVVAVIICLIPLFQIGIYQLTWLAWSVMAPAFIPIILGGLYWKMATKAGAVASLIAGPLTGFGWYYLMQENTNVHTFFVALLAAACLYILVSLFTKQQEDKTTDSPNAAKAETVLQVAEESQLPIDDSSKDAATEECKEVEPVKPEEVIEEQLEEIKVIEGVKYTADIFVEKINNSSKLKGISCTHIKTVYSPCWIIQFKIGLQVTKNTKRYAGYFAGYDQISMSAGRLASVPEGKMLRARGELILEDKITEAEAVKEAWNANKQAIIVKFKQLNNPPVIEEYEASKLYKPLYVMELVNEETKESKYKMVDSLTGELIDL